MNCDKCGNEVESTDDGYLYPKLDKLRALRGDYEIPFKCDECGSIHFPFRAVRDVVFIWPKPAPNRVGLIHLPEDTKFIGGGPRERFREPRAIILSVGRGYVNKKGKFVKTHSLQIGDEVIYEKRVPWRITLKGLDGKRIIVTACGFEDIYGLDNGDN